MSTRKRAATAPASASKSKVSRAKKSADPPAEDHEAPTQNQTGSNGRPKRGARSSKATEASPSLAHEEIQVEPVLLPSPSSRLSSLSQFETTSTPSHQVRVAASRSQTQRTADDDIVIYLMRHGTSEWNLLKKWQGATDTQLAPEGVKQARDAGMTLSLDGIVFEGAICSDLRRAHHTCELLLQTCGRRGCKARPDARLRECSLGEFEGQTKDNIYGERYAGLWARLSALPHEARLQTPYFEGLETPQQVGLRAATALVELASDARASASFGNGPLLAVTHSTVLESFLAAIFGADFDSVETKNLAWLKIRIAPHRLTPMGPLGWRLRLEDSQGAEWQNSPDALCLDLTAAPLMGVASGYLPASSDGLPTANATTTQQYSWMLWALVGSLLFAVAGVLKVVATGGKLGGVSTSSSSSYYWGPVTGSVDWCEANYAVLPHVAEMANSVSSLFFVGTGLSVALQARRAGAELRYQLLGVCLALVGLGSVAFHATLRKQEQALDEIPMLWLATLAAYCIFQGNRASTATLSQKSSSSSHLLPPPPYGLWLPSVLVFWCLGASAAQWSVTGGWQPIAFHLGFASAEAVFLRGAWLQMRRTKDQRTRAVLERAFVLYAVAIGTWALDNAFCQPLRQLTSLLTWGWIAYPQLHAFGWHGVMALASSLMILGGTTERLEFLADRPGHRVWLQPSSLFGFFWPALVHTSNVADTALK